MFNAMNDLTERPNRIPWPPILFAGAALVALGLEWVVPTSHGGHAIVRAIGAVLVAGGLSLDVWTALTFRRHATTIMPHRGADRLATDGPFRFSRNPIYLGNTLMVIGLGLAFDWLWAIPAAFVAALAVGRLAIAREERHLEARFGAAWRAYARRVRRWL